MARVSRKGKSAEVAMPKTIRIYKTAIYIRLSVEDIRKKISDSIGTQKTMLLEFLYTQHDLELFDIYEDVNYTGTNFNRPGFARLIEDIQAQRVNCVIVKDLSRFGRNFRETGNYLERVFPFLQIRFISVSENFDSLTASLDESGLSIPLKNLTNEVIARDISRKVQSGKKVKQQRGEFCGAFAPYGYIKVGGAFIVDDEAAAIVRKIFAYILEGLSDSAIAQKLNELKITPPNRYRFEKSIFKAKKHEESKFWYKSTVKRLSENPAYTGTMVSGKFQSNFLHSGGIIAKNKDEWIITENAHPAIIPHETFEAVQLIRSKRKKNCNKRNAWRENIFKGYIFCGDCNGHMTRKKRKEKFVYLCNIYQEVDKSSCTPKAITEADLHTALFTYVNREINLTVDVSRIIENLQKLDSYKHTKNAQDKQIKGLQGKLVQNRRFRGSLREDLKDGILSEQDYSTMKAGYDEERESLQQELDVLIAKESKQKNTFSLENKWIKEFKRFETEQQLSAQMLATIIKRINVYNNARIEVILHYRDEYEALKE
ncbi:MAG: recombinase family protein [Defluviitaleaceae bacterium]|nr:recombinase family protein [Defluviitaleaceae bacterium]